MKVWIRSGEVEVEVTARGAFNPDVLTDLTHRALEAILVVQMSDSVSAEE